MTAAEMSQAENFVEKTIMTNFGDGAQTMLLTMI